MDYQNYAMGKWVSGDGDGTPLFNAITGTEIGSANSKGLDRSNDELFPGDWQSCVKKNDLSTARFNAESIGASFAWH